MNKANGLYIVSGKSEIQFIIRGINIYSPSMILKTVIKTITKIL